MELPANVEVVQYKDKEIYLLGTAHVSKKSVEEVTECIEKFSPDAVCVELCESRLHSIENRDNWKQMDIFKIVKEKKTIFLFAQLMMSSFYRKLGKELEVTPGAEMIQGVTEARAADLELILADRNIEVTLKRVWGGLGFFQKLIFGSTMLSSFFFKAEEQIDDETIEKLKEADHLEDAMEEFAKAYPGIRERLIFERDIYLAEKIKEAKGSKVLAVVGAGHVPGIKQRIFEDNELGPISEIPPKSIVPKLISWCIPLAIIALMVWGFVQGGTEQGSKMVMIWVLMNGAFSAFGALMALAHPVTILAAFIAAPITSLNPMIGVGFVTGLVQAYFKKPTVADLENVPEATESIKGFWHNSLTRVLLVVILSSIGSMIGTFGAPAFMAMTMREQPTEFLFPTASDTLQAQSVTTIQWKAPEKEVTLQLFQGDSLVSTLCSLTSAGEFDWTPTVSGSYSLQLLSEGREIQSETFVIKEKE